MTEFTSGMKGLTAMIYTRSPSRLAVGGLGVVLHELYTDHRAEAAIRLVEERLHPLSPTEQRGKPWYALFFLLTVP